MVRHALITAALVLVAWPVHAQSLDLRLPSCAPTHLDTTLFRELVLIELGDRAWQMTIGGSFCDASSTTLEIEVVDPRTGAQASELVPLAMDDDPRAATRAAALAIAERAPRLVLIAPAPAPAHTRTLDRASVLAAPSAPRGRDTPLRLPPTLDVGLVGRIAPVLPSWALGVRIALGASFDPTWSIRGELLSTWTRATAYEGDVDAIVIAGALAIGASLFRDAAFDLVLAGRVEAGVLAGLGWSAGASTGAASLHAWIVAGPDLDGIVTLAPGVALVVDVGLAAILYGTRLSTWPSGTQIDLSYFAFDLGAGIRIAL